MTPKDTILVSISQNWQMHSTTKRSIRAKESDYSSNSLFPQAASQLEDSHNLLNLYHGHIDSKSEFIRYRKRAHLNLLQTLNQPLRDLPFGHC